MSRLYPSIKQSLLLLPLLSVLLLAGCVDSKTPQSKKKPAATAGTNDTQFTTNSAMTNSAPPADGSMTDSAVVTNSVANNPSNPFPTPTPVPVAAPRDLPYGTPVPGKPGIVINPYAPTNAPDKDRWIDVRGYAPSMEVRDPVSGKTFLVP